VERPGECDDFGRTAAVLLAPFSRELDRAFVGFGSAIAEEDPVEFALFAESL
jgi:hypothetical protein